MLIFAALAVDYLHVEMQPSDHPNPPSSFHLPLLSLHPLFHTVSIPMCKGHPGNREAAVDREINKQKKRERSDGGQSLMIHRVNYRPTSHKHTPKAAGSWGGVRPLLSFAVFVYMSLLLVFSALSLFFLSISLCSPCIAFWCCFSLPVSPSLPPSLRASLGTESTQAIGVCRNLFGQRRHFVFAGAGCFCLLLFGENLRCHYC